MKTVYSLSLILFIAAAALTSAMAHCEVPCGIYDDQARTDMIAEHITTIEKAMKQITALSGQSPVNYNQAVRWVMTKEEHATKIQTIVSQYFLTQRIKSKRRCGLRQEAGRTPPDAGGGHEVQANHRSEQRRSAERQIERIRSSLFWSQPPEIVFLTAGIVRCGSPRKPRRPFPFIMRFTGKVD